MNTAMMRKTKKKLKHLTAHNCQYSTQRFDYDDITTTTELLQWLNTAEKRRLILEPRRSASKKVTSAGWVRVNSISPDGRLLAVGCDANTITFFHTSNFNRPVKVIKTKNPPACIEFSRDSQLLAYACKDEVHILRRLDILGEESHDEGSEESDEESGPSVQIFTPGQPTQDVGLRPPSMSRDEEVSEEEQFEGEEREDENIQRRDGGHWSLPKTAKAKGTGQTFFLGTVVSLSWSPKDNSIDSHTKSYILAVGVQPESDFVDKDWGSYRNWDSDRDTARDTAPKLAFRGLLVTAEILDFDTYFPMFVEDLPYFSTASHLILKERAKKVDSVSIVLFHPSDGRMFIGGSNKQACMLSYKAGPELEEYDLEDAEIGSTLPANSLRLLGTFKINGDVTAAALSPSGTTIYITTTDNLVTRFHLADFKQMGEPTDTEALARSVAVSLDGTLLAVGGEDKKATVFCAASLEKLYSYSFTAAVRSVSFTNNRDLLVGGLDSSTHIYSTLAGQTNMRFEEQQRAHSRTTAVDLSPEVAVRGKSMILAARGSYNGYVRVFNSRRARQSTRDDGTTSVKPLWTKRHEESAPVRSLRFSAHGTKLAVGYADGTCTVYHSGSGHPLKRLPTRYGEITTVDFSRDGRFLVVGGQDGVVKQYYADNCNDVSDWERESPVTCMGFAANGKRIAVGGEDQRVLVFNTVGKVLLELERQGRVNTVQFTSGMDVVFVGSSDGVGAAYSVDSGELLFEVHFPGPVLSAAKSPRADRLVVCYLDRADNPNAAMYDSKTGQLEFVFDRKERCTSAAFGPDGDWVIFGNDVGDTVVCSGAMQDSIPLEFIELTDTTKLAGPLRAYMSMPSTSDELESDKPAGKGGHLIITLLEVMIKQKKIEVAMSLLEHPLVANFIDELTLMLAVQLRDRTFLKAILHAAATAEFIPARAAVVSVIPALVNFGFTKTLSDFMDELDMEEVFECRATASDSGTRPLASTVGPKAMLSFDASYREFQKYRSENNGAVAKARRVALPGLICRPVLTALIEAADQDLWVSPVLNASIEAGWKRFKRDHVATIQTHFLQVAIFTYFAILVTNGSSGTIKGYLCAVLLLLSALYFIRIETLQWNGFFLRENKDTIGNRNNFKNPADTSWHWKLTATPDPHMDFEVQNPVARVATPTHNEQAHAELEMHHYQTNKSVHKKHSLRAHKPKQIMNYPQMGEPLIPPEELQPLSRSPAAGDLEEKAAEEATEESKGVEESKGEDEELVNKWGLEDLGTGMNAMFSDASLRALVKTLDLGGEGSNSMNDLTGCCGFCKPTHDGWYSDLCSRLPGYLYFRSVYKQMDMWNLVDIVCQIVLVANATQYLLEDLVAVESKDQQILLAISPFFLLGRTMSLFRGFEQLGWIVSVLIQNTKDMQAFLIVVAAFIYFNAISYMCLFANVDDDFDPDDDFVGATATFQKAMLQVFNMGILGDFAVGGYSESAAPWFTFVLYIMYMVAVGLVALNAVIALLGDSFEAVQDRIAAELNILRANLMVDYLDALPTKNGQGVKAAQLESTLLWVHELRPEAKMHGSDDEWAGRMKEIGKAVDKAALRSSRTNKQIREDFEDELEQSRSTLQSSIRNVEYELHSQVKRDLSEVCQGQALTEHQLRQDIHSLRSSMNTICKTMLSEVDGITGQLQADLNSHLEMIARRLPAAAEP